MKLVKSEQVRLELRTALYQPYGDWIIDTRGNLFILYSTQIQDSNYHHGVFAKLADGRSWNISYESLKEIFYSGPLIFRDNKALTFSFGDNHTFATAFLVEIETGRIMWNYSLPHYLPMGLGISRDDQVAYFSQFGSTCALKKSTGEIVWKNEIDFTDGKFRAIQGISDQLIIATESGDCCSGSRVMALNPLDGRKIWEQNFFAYSDWKGYDGGYGVTVDKKNNLYLGLSHYGVAALSTEGEVLFNYSLVSSEWAVPYCFQPLLLRNSIGLFFVIFWAGDDANNTRQNFITTFKYGMLSF